MDTPYCDAQLQPMAIPGAQPPRYKNARERMEVQAVTELGGNDQFKEAPIASFLPVHHSGVQISHLAALVKSKRLPDSDCVAPSLVRYRPCAAHWPCSAVAGVGREDPHPVG